MRKLLSILLAVALCLSLGTVAFASGEASGGSGGMGGSSNLAGMLSMKNYVSVGEASDTVSFEVYGVLTAGGEDDAAAYVIDQAADPAGLTYTVYADRDMTEEAEGVTAAVAGGVLTLTGVDPAGNTAYYIGSDYPAETLAPTVVYVVNDEYDAPVDYELADGTTIALSEYAPGVASESASSVYIGANTALFTAADYGITDPDEAAIADWWLGAGITNAGSSLTEFGDTFYRFELCFDLYRQLQMLIDHDTTVGAANGWADPADSNPSQPTNDQYSDAVSATVYAGVWDGIYTTLNADGYLENIPGVTELGMNQPVDEETLFVLVYNGLVSPWATLNEAGRALAAGLDASTAAEKVAQAKAALGMEDWSADSYSTQKLAVLDVLKALDAYVAPKASPDADLQARIEAAGYAVVNTATADISANIGQLAARTIDTDTAITGEDLTTEYPTSLFIKGGHVTITDSTIVSSGSNSEAGPAGKTAQEILDLDTSSMPYTSRIGYNVTTAMAYYREGYGGDLVAWGPDTVVELGTTTGELVISAPSGGSMAGGLFNAFGASILVKNAIAFSAGQHLSNTVYNGTIHYKDAVAIGGGRMYSSDFWGGNVVFENTIAAGGDVTDEPTTMIAKNTVFKGTGSINGYATMYFENTLIEGGNFGTQNNTSLVSDTATVTLVNSVMDGSSFLSLKRASRAVATLVDSTVILSGDTLATLSNVYSGEEFYTSGSLGDGFYDMFQTEGEIRVYGDSAVFFEGDTLKVDVDTDQTLRLYVNEIVGGDIENVGEGSFEIVTGDEYGVLYLNTEPAAEEEAPAAAESAAESAAGDAAAGDTPAGFDESMNAGLDASVYPHFDEFRDYTAELALADSFMANQDGIPDDIYEAASPYIAPFSDINPVIGAADYATWMRTNYPGEDFPAA